MALTTHYKALIEPSQRKITPSESDLAIIEQFALAGEPVNAADLFIGRMSLANDQYDRSHERFPESYLAQFAHTIPGKSVMIGHNYDDGPSGRIFKAEVTSRLAPESQRQPLAAIGKELVVGYYLLADSELARKVRSGIARDVSIGFYPDQRICDLCEKDYDGWMKGDDDPCPHVAGHEYDNDMGRAPARVTYGGNVEKVEALEGSFVWLGCQYGAQAINAMRAFSPQAKAAFFDSRAGKGVWAFPESFSATGTTAAVAAGPYAVDLRIPRSDLHLIKEAPVNVPKESAPPPEPAPPALSPEQERLIALGKAYIEDRQAHVKSRYGPCGQEKTGEVIAQTFETATAEQIKASVEAADELFNKTFPGTAKGVPMTDQQTLKAERRFNPFRQPVPRS